MKNKNEIFRWIIVALCSFEIYRFAKIVISTITNYKQQLAIITGESDLIKNYKIATPIQIVGSIILIFAFLMVIYYFVFCFGKQIKTKLLGGAVLVQSVCMFLLFICGILLNYNLFIESFKDLEFGGIYYLLSGILSHTYTLVHCIILLVVAITIFKNIQHIKSIKVTCIVLVALYIVLELLHLFSICMFYSSFENSSSSFVSTFFKNLISVDIFLDLNILFYIFFMDKDYKRVKQIEE